MDTEEAKAAISADSRQYNVFTFLEDDDDHNADNNDDDNTTSSRPSLPGFAETEEVSTSTPVSVPDIIEKLTVNEETAAVEDKKSSSLKNDGDEEQDTTPDLDLPVIRPLSNDDYTNDLPPSVKRKIVPHSPFDMDVTLSPASSLPDLYEFDGMRTPDELDDSALHDADVDYPGHMLSGSMFGPDLDWEDNPDAVPIDPIPEYTARQEFEDSKKWRVVQIADKTYRIDMESVGSYKNVLSHGGYYGDGLNAIVVFTACHLPDKTNANYHYIMDNLFLYVMSTLELLVVQEYMIVYFHSASSRRKLPGLRWFKRCYDMVDRRLRKNLQGLLVVHPTLFLKTVMLMMKPFVSSKFSAKMRYVNSLAELTRHVPTEYMFIPDEVIQFDCASVGVSSRAATGV